MSPKKFDPIPKDSKLEEWLQAGLIFVILVALFGGCVYRVGYPWTCEDAKREAAKIAGYCNPSVDPQKCWEQTQAEARANRVVYEKCNK